MSGQTSENKMYGGDYQTCEICGRKSKETELREGRRLCISLGSCQATIGNVSFGGPAMKIEPINRFELDDDDRVSIQDAVHRRLLQLAQSEVVQADSELEIKYVAGPWTCLICGKTLNECACPCLRCHQQRCVCEGDHDARE